MAIQVRLDLTPSEFDLDRRALDAYAEERFDFADGGASNAMPLSLTGTERVELKEALNGILANAGVELRRQKVLHGVREKLDAVKNSPPQERRDARAESAQAKMLLAKLNS